MDSTTRDKNITLVRVVAMLSIILCHILSEFKQIRFLGQVFNVGVFTFIFISGILYGKKDIDNIGSWLIKRATRIFIPMYIFMIFLFGLRIILFNQFEPKNYLIYLLNLQGLMGGVEGAGHLWFLTLIMVCYLITPLLNKIKNKVLSLTKVELTLSLFMLIGMQIILSSYLNKIIGLYLCYLILYTFAYFFSNLWDKTVSKKGLIIYTLLTIFAVGIRLVTKFIMDGSILYNNVIVLYSQSILGVWIFVFISYFKELSNNKIIDKIVNNLDKLSFEIYITHYMFIVGPLKVMSLTNYYVINIIIVLALSYVSGIILHILCDTIYELDFFKRKVYRLNQSA